MSMLIYVSASMYMHTLYIIFCTKKKYIYTSYGSVDRIAYPKCEPHNTKLMGKENPTTSQ